MQQGTVYDQMNEEKIYKVRSIEVNPTESFNVGNIFSRFDLAKT
jgi:hypothetical protein